MVLVHARDPYDPGPTDDDFAPTLAIAPVSVATSTRGRVVTVALSGELDIASTDRVAEALVEAQPTGSGRLVIDLRRLSFLDSSGLRTLLAAHSRADEGGGRVSLVAGPGPVRQLLDLVQVGEVVEVLEEPPGA